MAALCSSDCVSGPDSQLSTRRRAACLLRITTSTYWATYLGACQLWHATPFAMFACLKFEHLSLLCAVLVAPSSCAALDSRRYQSPVWPNLLCPESCANHHIKTEQHWCTAVSLRYNAATMHCLGHCRKSLILLSESHLSTDVLHLVSLNVCNVCRHSACVRKCLATSADICMSPKTSLNVCTV